MNRTEALTQLLNDFDRLKRRVGVKVLSGGSLHNITAAQWGVLFTMEAGKGHSVKDIAKALGVTSSAATQLLDALVRSGYAMRHGSRTDRRLVMVMLSKKGVREVARLKSQVLHNSLKAFAALSDKELRQYCLLTKKLTRDIDR